MVDKVDPGCVGQSHFPSGRQRAELGDGLLLNGAAVGGLSPIHPNVLLTAGVDPGGGAGVVVDKIWPAFRGMPLLPARRELARTGCRGPGSHHTHCTGRSSCGRRRLAIGQGGGVCTGAVFGQHAVLVAGAFLLGLRGHCCALVGFVEAGAWPDPGGLARVVVNVVGTAQVVLATLPALGQTALCVLKGAVGTVAGWSGSARGRSRGWARREASGWWLAEAWGAGLGGHGRAELAGIGVGRVEGGGLGVWCGGCGRSDGAGGGVRARGRAGSGRGGLCQRRTEV